MIPSIYFLVAAVVLSPVLMAMVFITLRCELRARKRPDPFEDYFKSLDMPHKLPGRWF